MDRRTFVTSSLGALAASRLTAQPSPQISLESLPGLWDVDRSIANLENAYWGAMPRAIYDDYLHFSSPHRQPPQGSAPSLAA